MNDLRDVIKFDAALKIGDSVTVRWTWCHGYYEAQGKVSKLNAKSLRVALDHDVPTSSGGWQAGFEIRVPRAKFGSLDAWSWNNGSFPPQVV